MNLRCSSSRNARLACVPRDKNRASDKRNDRIGKVNVDRRRARAVYRALKRQRKGLTRAK